MVRGPLLEEGIEDMENLATANLVDVILHTHVPVLGPVMGPMMRRQFRADYRRLNERMEAR